MKKSNIVRGGIRSLVIVSLIAALALPATASARGPQGGYHPAPASYHHGSHPAPPPPSHGHYHDGGPRYHGGHHHSSDSAADVIGAVACTALGIGLLSALLAD